VGRYAARGSSSSRTGILELLRVKNVQLGVEGSE
jgi:hypothetical protein